MGSWAITKTNSGISKTAEKSARGAIGKKVALRPPRLTKMRVSARRYAHSKYRNAMRIGRETITKNKLFQHPSFHSRLIPVLFC